MADIPSTPLPDDVEALKRLVVDLAGQVRTLQSDLGVRELLIEHMKLQIAAMQRQLFGRKSEKLEAELANSSSNSKSCSSTTAKIRHRRHRPQKPTPIARVSRCPNTSHATPSCMRRRPTPAPVAAVRSRKSARTWPNRSTMSRKAGV
jgi:hypothetical protein